MGYYCLINSKGIEVHESKKMLLLSEMQNLVGIPNEKAYIEAVYQNYSDKLITLIVDEEFLLKYLSSTMLSKSGVLHGQILVVSNSGEDFKLLTKKQVEIIQKETQLVGDK